MIEVDCGKLMHTQTQTGRHTHTQVEKEREVRGEGIKMEREEVMKEGKSFRERQLTGVFLHDCSC